MRLRDALLSSFLTFVFVILVGCNGNVHVTGRVTFPNGQPLTVGKVIFTDDFYMGKSNLNKNGEYSIHTFRRDDGIKKGVYRAYIVGAVRFEPGKNVKDSLQDYTLDNLVLLIDMQHTNPDTSGWVYDVQKNSKIDFVVYPPGEVPENERTESAKMMFDPEYRKKVQEQKAKEEGIGVSKLKKRRTVNPNLL